jgi:hypothetical protein
MDTNFDRPLDFDRIYGIVRILIGHGGQITEIQNSLFVVQIFLLLHQDLIQIQNQLRNVRVGGDFYGIE